MTPGAQSVRNPKARSLGAAPTGMSPLPPCSGRQGDSLSIGQTSARWRTGTFLRDTGRLREQWCCAGTRQAGPRVERGSEGCPSSHHRRRTSGTSAFDERTMKADKRSYARGGCDTSATTRALLSGKVRLRGGRPGHPRVGDLAQEPRFLLPDSHAEHGDDGPLAGEREQRSAVQATGEKDDRAGVVWSDLAAQLPSRPLAP